MDIVPNHAKHRLVAGALALGMGVRQSRTVDIATIARTCSFDWLFIDMEHSSLDVDASAQLACASLAAGITPVVRVPGHEHDHASRRLEARAQAIVAPHVETAEQARRIAQARRYPPAGHRSVAGALPRLGCRALPLAEARRLVDEETLVVAMLEAQAAIDRAEEIAQVEGVHVLRVGTNDLRAEKGIPGAVGDPRVEDADRRVIAACRRHGKRPGMGGVYEPPLMRKYTGLGMRFIPGGFDLSFLMAGARARAALLRAAGSEAAGAASCAER